MLKYLKQWFKITLYIKQNDIQKDIFAYRHSLIVEENRYKAIFSPSAMSFFANITIDHFDDTIEQDALTTPKMAASAAPGAPKTPAIAPAIPLGPPTVAQNPLSGV